MFSTIGAVPVPPQETIQQAHSIILIHAHPVCICERYTPRFTTQHSKKPTFTLPVNDFDKSRTTHNLRRIPARTGFPITIHS